MSVIKTGPTNKKLVFKGTRWNVYQWQQEEFDGNVKTYETVGRKDVVFVIPVTDEKILLIEEKQPHWEKSGVTFVAGSIEDEETPCTAARREVEEETGYVFDKFYCVFSDRLWPSLDWKFHVVVAKNLIERKSANLEPGEQIKPFEVNFDSLIKKCKEREFVYRPFFVDDYIIKDEIEIFFDLLRNPEKYEIK